MKRLPLIVPFIGLIAFIALYCYLIYVSNKDNSFEVYTPIDIIYVDLNTNHITSESGDIDTVFNFRKDMYNYLSDISANHSNKCL